MQTFQTRRSAPSRVMIVNAVLAISGALLFLGYFGGWLEGSGFVGGLLLLFGSGCAAEGVLRRIGWLAESGHPTSRIAPWLVLFGVSMMVWGVLMLLGG